MIRNRIFVLVALVLFVPRGVAFKCKDPLSIIFINGVFNTRDEAAVGVDALKNKLYPHMFEHVGIEWSRNRIVLGYNPTSGLTDLLEAYRQKLGEDTQGFWSWLRHLEIAPSFFKERISRYLPHKEEKALAVENLSYQVSSYILDKGHRVLLIAHSQGNFFANLTMKDVSFMPWEDHRKSVALLSVATPASYVEGGGPYVTLESDGVIKYIPNSLPPNVSNSYPKPGFFDHGFVQHYLGGNGARPAIEKNVYSLAGFLAKADKSQNLSRCMQWFRENVAYVGADKSSCLSRCNTARVGMGDFDCTGQCLKLCSCTN